MTAVTIILERPAQDGTMTAASGTAVFAPTARRADSSGTPSRVVLPLPISVAIPVTGATVTLAPTGPSWCWMASLAVDGSALAWTEYVSVGTAPTAGWPDLTRLDPTTLLPQTVQSAANATTGAPGLVQLAGDLGGTASSPTVLTVNGGPVATPASATALALVFGG